MNNARDYQSRARLWLILKYIALAPATADFGTLFVFQKAYNEFKRRQANKHFEEQLIICC